ncbi:hypothetical protein QFZ67_000086 [Streptomyces sp. V1I1]|nr:hypothetical protein [Streptomyces sp. V1I1]
MCDAVQKSLTDVTQIRLFLLSNGGSTSTAPSPTEFEGIPVLHEIWDLPRLHRHETSGTLSEPSCESPREIDSQTPVRRTRGPSLCRPAAYLPDGTEVALWCSKAPRREAATSRRQRRRVRDHDVAEALIGDHREGASFSSCGFIPHGGQAIHVPILAGQV